MAYKPAILGGCGIACYPIGLSIKINPESCLISPTRSGGCGKACDPIGLSKNATTFCSAASEPNTQINNMSCNNMPCNNIPCNAVQDVTGSRNVIPSTITHQCARAAKKTTLTVILAGQLTAVARWMLIAFEPDALI